MRNRRPSNQEKFRWPCARGYLDDKMATDIRELPTPLWSPRPLLFVPTHISLYVWSSGPLFLFYPPTSPFMWSSGLLLFSHSPLSSGGPGGRCFSFQPSLPLCVLPDRVYFFTHPPLPSCGPRWRCVFYYPTLPSLLCNPPASYFFFTDPQAQMDIHRRVDSQISLLERNNMSFGSFACRPCTFVVLF